MAENTKKNDSNAGTPKREQFSPVSKSLGTKVTPGKSLTGHARHVRDMAAEIHACIQQWNTFHLHGVSILKSITQEKQDESYSQTLQELCDKLERDCDAFDSIVKNLGQLAHQFNIITSLDRSTDKLFVTWPTAKFGHVAESIHNAYYHEAQIKRKVLEDVAHYNTESLKMLCLATWVHQPLIPENVTILLESMLTETGHR